MERILQGEREVSLMFGNLGFWEILVIAAVLVLLFGGKRIPELASGLGRGIANFKKALKETS
jgi:sec-independent protein translocase protein TatA